MKRRCIKDVSWLLLTTLLSWQVGAIPDNEFETLTQKRGYRAEEFLELKEHPELPSSLFLKYLKLSSLTSSLTDQSNENLREQQAGDLTGFFTQKCPLWEDGPDEDGLRELKFTYYFAQAIRPYEEGTYHLRFKIINDLLKELFVAGDGLRGDAYKPALYWAWKHRETLGFFTPPVWQQVLQQAAGGEEGYYKAKYALGRSLREIGQDLTQADLLLRAAAAQGYEKAQLYLDYLETTKKHDPQLRRSFLEKLANTRTKLLDQSYPRYPYAGYLMAQEDWSSVISGSLSSVEEKKQFLSHLLNAYRSGIKEAQDKLDVLKSINCEEFYRLSCLVDHCQNDQERLSFLTARAERKMKGEEYQYILAPYAYQLAQMYEDGRGTAFEMPDQWLNAFEQAKYWYDRARLIDGRVQPNAFSQRVENKIAHLQGAQGYILNKIRRGATVSFSPKHPLFEEFSAFISHLNKYSPSVRDLGAIIVQQILDSGTAKQDARTIMDELLATVRTEEFKNYLAEENEGAEEAAKLFQYLVDKSSSVLKGQAEQNSSLSLAKFIEASKGFIFNKIRKAIDSDIKAGKCLPLTPAHPLFAEFCEIIHELSRYEGTTPEHGAHLVQQLLYFPAYSRQAGVLTASLLDLLHSRTFQQGKEGDKQEDIEDRRNEKLAQLNQAIELTRLPRKLLLADKGEQEGGIPKKVKVNPALFRDPRIQVFNYYFEQEDKPFDQTKFTESVDYLLQLFDDLTAKGKITAKSLKESLKEYKNEEGKPRYANRKTLQMFLWRGEEKINQIPNQFAHRIIKIKEIFKNGQMDEDTKAAQLSSWAVAGFHCETRCEGETHRFYAMQITEGKSQENENDTLEMKVAVALADLRRQLLHQLAPLDEPERLHPLAYLEREYGKKLALVAPQEFKDSHAKIVKNYYKSLDFATVKHYLKGGDALHYKIKPGKGYSNPATLIKYLTKVINNPQSSITIELILKRFEDNYGSEYLPYLAAYYDEELTDITPQGVKALLYSLGYLEKNMGPKPKKNKL